MFQLKSVSFTHAARDDGGQFRLFIDDVVIPQTGITAVIGPSGSGKTTFLSLLSGFAPADAEAGGGLTFDGRDMIVSPRHGPGQVAYVFQSPMLLRPSSGTANAIQGAMLSRRTLDQNRISELLQALDLNEDGGRLLSGRVENHSGGEAQRIAVLRALLSDAHAILCDEPTSSLDEKNAGEVLSAFHDWSHLGQRPVIWVTHDLHHSAEYADHFLFLRDGKVRHPRTDLRDALQDGDLHARVAALKALAEDDDADDCSDPTSKSGVISRNTGRTVSAYSPPQNDIALPSRWAFLRWTAQALSTGTARGQKAEENRPGILTPAGEAKFTASIVHAPEQTRPGRLAHALAVLWAYNRWGLTFVFLATLLQVVAALFLKDAAGTFYANKLQDPAVARIGFEHVIESLARRGAGETAADLTPAAIRTMTEELRARMEGRLTPEELKRIQIKGRRHERTRLRFASGPCNRWVGFDTVILSLDDPLLNQIVFQGAAADPALARELAKGLDLADALQALRQDTGQGAIIVDAALARQMWDACGVAEGAAAVVEWIYSDTLRPSAIKLPIVAVAREMPPVHPFTPLIIVFEPEFQAQLQTSDTLAPGSFRVANLYFPIEMFDEAEAYLLEKGYTTITDSRAAVQTLRQMAGLTQILPLVIVAINGLVTVIIVSIIIGNVLELNKRVFTLFNAYGYRLADVLALIIMHLLPALVLSALTVGALVFGLAWLLLGDLAQIGNPIQFAASSLFVGVILQTLLVFVIACVTVALWWRHAGRNLGSLLKE